MRSNSIRLFRNAWKNSQREAQKEWDKLPNTKPYFFYIFDPIFEKKLNELGFSDKYGYWYHTFICYLRQVSSRRRQSIMRLGRAALKQGKVVDISNLVSYGLRSLNNFKTQDLRLIEFVTPQPRDLDN